MKPTDEEKTGAPDTSDFEPEGTARPSGPQDKVQSTARPYLSDQKNKMTAQLTGTARALRQSETQMPNDGSAVLIRKSAEAIEWVGSYLQERDVDALIADIQNFARRRPWWIVGGAFVAGLAAARFMKSSGRQPSASLGSHSAEARFAPPSSRGAMSEATFAHAEQRTSTPGDSTEGGTYADTTTPPRR